MAPVFGLAPQPKGIGDLAARSSAAVGVAVIVSRSGMDVLWVEGGQATHGVCRWGRSWPQRGCPALPQSCGLR